MNININKIGTGLRIISGNPLEAGLGTPSVDALYGPYPTLTDALTCIVQAYGNAASIPQGLTVGIIPGTFAYDESEGDDVFTIGDGAEIKEYWFKGKKSDTGYTVDDLVEKNSEVTVDANTMANVITAALTDVTDNGENASADNKALIEALDSYLTRKNVVITEE